MAIIAIVANMGISLFFILPPKMLVSDRLIRAMSLQYKLFLAVLNGSKIRQDFGKQD
jgi:hypothetical protein